MCVYILKQVISFYINCKSPMYIAYLDASKAFNRLNYWKLCDKLLERKVPVIFVRFLMYWYTHQQFLVKWCNTLSNSFLVGNGVRQGGVLSPV